MGNNTLHLGVQWHVFITGKWFPLVLAVGQTVRHIGLITYGYWAAVQTEKRFDVEEFMRQDLARPLFEPYGFCGGHRPHGTVFTANVGLDLPVYWSALVLHSVVNWQPSCDDALMTPRGQLITAALVPPFWFLVGLSVRRLAQRRWRRRTTRPITRVLLSFGLIPLPFAVLGLLLNVLGLFVSSVWSSIQVAGISLWEFHVAA